jgi:hypothetical protein
MTEQDPTAMDPEEPDEETLPPKPPITDPMPSDEEIENEPVPSDEEEAEAEADIEWMEDDEADDDDTVDNMEESENPHEDLPEGTRAQDYTDIEQGTKDKLTEMDDSEEQTPPRR